MFTRASRRYPTDSTSTVSQSPGRPLPWPCGARPHLARTGHERRTPKMDWEVSDPASEVVALRPPAFGMAAACLPYFAGSRVPRWATHFGAHTLRVGPGAAMRGRNCMARPASAPQEGAPTRRGARSRARATMPCCALNRCGAPASMPSSCGGFGPPARAPPSPEPSRGPATSRNCSGTRPR